MISTHVQFFLFYAQKNTENKHISWILYDTKISNIDLVKNNIMCSHVFGFYCCYYNCVYSI